MLTAYTHLLSLLKITLVTYCVVWTSIISPAYAAEESSSYLENKIRDFLLEKSQTQWLQKNKRIINPRIEIKISAGALEKINNLTIPVDCNQAQLSLPTNQRLIGRITLQMNCPVVEPAPNIRPEKIDVVNTAYKKNHAQSNKFQMFRLPVEILAFATIPTSSRTMSPGTAITSEDLVLTEVELNHYLQKVAVSSEELLGMQVTRLQRLGEPFFLESLKVKPIFNPGDSVRILVQGTGFSIDTLGRTTQAANIGQTIKVQLDSGKQLSGVVTAEKKVFVHVD